MIDLSYSLNYQIFGFNSRLTQSKISSTLEHGIK